MLVLILALGSWLAVMVASSGDLRVLGLRKGESKMRKPIRLSVMLLAAMVVLLSIQFDAVAQKKKRSKHKKVTQSTPVVVVPYVYNSQDNGTTAGDSAGDSMVNTAAPAPAGRGIPGSQGGGLGVEGTGSGSSGKRTRGGILTVGPITPSAGTLLISEFRLRGPSGANDEFIEIYNNSGADHTVVAAAGTGYGVYASDGVIRCLIPNGTIIPNKGHFLCVNSVAYSLTTYANGNGTTATGDATYATDIPDNAGIALFNNNAGGGFLILANRFDAVGSTSEANTLYKEGTGYATLTPFSINYAWVRDECGKGAAVNTLGPCTISTPKDTDNNAADFYFVDTNGTSAGGGQRLGAPGPQNLSSPIQRNSTVAAVLLDASVLAAGAPNRVRDFTSVPANNSTFGTLSIRRRFVNNTGANVTRLRFRIIDLDTFPAASGFADMRPITSSDVVVAGVNDAATCTAAGQAKPCSITVKGTHLEGNGVGESPNQPNGGGFNSSYSADSITLATPLANGASINVQFLLGIQQTGNFRIYVNIEALP
jgi:hypothetical protein